MLHWASRHRSVTHSNILLMNKMVYRLDIFLVAIGSVSYLILIQQDHLGIWEFTPEHNDMVVFRKLETYRDITHTKN
jgi:hypothetical protein